MATHLGDVPGTSIWDVHLGRSSGTPIWDVDVHLGCGRPFGIPIWTFLFCGTLNPSPPSGRVRGLRGPTSLPRCARLISSAPQIGSAPSRRVDSHQATPVTKKTFCYSRIFSHPGYRKNRLSTMFMHLFAIEGASMTDEDSAFGKRRPINAGCVRCAAPTPEYHQTNDWSSSMKLPCLRRPWHRPNTKPGLLCDPVSSGPAVHREMIRVRFEE